MTEWLGGSLPVFLGLGALVGLAAFLAGQAVASNWRSPWLAALYCLLLALGWRFLSYALFGAELLSPRGLLADLLVALAVGLLAYRITYVSRMVSQYPWLYRRRGLLAFEERTAGE